MRDLFRNRWRSTRATAQIIHRRRHHLDQDPEQQQAYAKLIQISEQVVRQAQTIAAALAQRAEREAQRLRQCLETMAPRVQQVIGQTRRRVLQGQAVPASEKLVSRFEPHTRIIPQLKAGAQVEFGNHVVLQEVEGGIVTGWSILDAASEQPELVPAWHRHRRLFGRPPHLLAADRGHHPLAHQQAAREAGVARVAIP
jgi:IS5 family transposase